MNQSYEISSDEEKPGDSVESIQKEMINSSREEEKIETELAIFVDEKESEMYENITMADIPRSVYSYPLLHFNPNTKDFNLSQNARDMFSSLEGSIYIVSISGNPLLGKSTLLNLLISCWGRQGMEITYRACYEVGKGLTSTTQGLNFHLFSTGNNSHYLVIDIEGDNDPARKGEGVWFYTNLISLAIGISHSHIYNYERLPQQSFIDYFLSCKQQEKQRQIHPNFETLFYFVKRNYTYTSENFYVQDVVNHRQDFELDFPELFHNNCVFLIPQPPEHVSNPKCPNPCIGENKKLCKKCIETNFMQNVIDLANRLYVGFSKTKPYKGGEEVLRAISLMLKINKEELPFSDDLDHLTKLRQAKLQSDYDLISQAMLKIEPEEKHKHLFVPVDDLPVANLQHDEINTMKSVDQIRKLIAIKYIHAEFLLPILRDFVEQKLLDDSYIIYNDTEKNILRETHISFLDQNLTEMAQHFENYEIYFRVLMRYFEELEKEAVKTFGDIDIQFARKKFDAVSKGTISGATIFSSALLALIGREAAVRILGGVLLTGGALGILFAVYTLIDGVRQYKKFKEEKSKKFKISNLFSSKKKDKEKVELILCYLKVKLHQYQSKHKVIKELAEKALKMELFPLISKLLDKKTNQEEITPEDMAELKSQVGQAFRVLKLTEQCIDINIESSKI